ncbi:ParB/RepB/Spo0J family partition protein [Microbacterium algeriense]|uniref:ParB/RepB/Spo0J family partition protein n=1 Tax=Microbacterium algeriense TaxID=2615184 RepID=UPI0022E327E2|nr:ParB/RepB/Spo0J family partition protein [Microbacterium algeriense]
MKLIDVKPEDLSLSPDLVRSGSAKSFEDRLRASVDEIGIAEPLKVAATPEGSYLVIDGSLRLRAVLAIREKDPTRFPTIPAYLLDYDLRYEIRFQSDIYQDLLPSQIATLVEHLHKSENVRKIDIARYIGISPATLRNYTGLGRLMERGGLPARVVELMDVGVFPSSNPYAWLRLTDAGIERVLRERFAKDADPEAWVGEMIDAARLGGNERYPLKYIEMVTAALPAEYYHSGEDVRAIKRDLGLRRAAGQRTHLAFQQARSHLSQVSKESSEPVLVTAAHAFDNYLARLL